MISISDGWKFQIINNLNLSLFTFFLLPCLSLSFSIWNFSHLLYLLFCLTLVHIFKLCPCTTFCLMPLFSDSFCGSFFHMHLVTFEKFLVLNNLDVLLLERCGWYSFHSLYMSFQKLQYFEFDYFGDSHSQLFVWL